MEKKLMPVIFAGHGSPMMTLEDTQTTRTLHQIGEQILKDFGKPKAILAISGHWYTRGSWINAATKPEQVYDMYGFPQELYDFQYPAAGDPALAREVRALTHNTVHLTEEWGIDHGVWSILAHMFPHADIPVVEMSVDGTLSTKQMYALGEELSPLREDGVLILASGNIVHNLRFLDWSMNELTPEAEAFNSRTKTHVLNREDEILMKYHALPGADYSVPTPEHFLPLLYALGAAKHQKPVVFNDLANGGSVSMTGFIFGLPESGEN